MANGPRTGVLLAAALLAALVAASVPMGAGAAADSPTLHVTDADVDVDGTGQAVVNLSRAPDGLSGFELNVSVGDGSVAAVVSASYPSSFALTETTTNDDNTTITVKAADLQNNTVPGDTDIRLATIDVRGESDGTTDLTIDVVKLDDDAGGPIQAATDPGTVTVGTGSGGSTATATPTATERTTTPGGGDTATSTVGSTTTAGTATTDGDPAAGPAPNTTGTSPSTEEATTGGSTLIRTDSPTPSAPGTTTTAGATGTPGQPGFGALVALAVLAGAVMLAARRR